MSQRLCNVTTGTILASNVIEARTFWQRTVGFLGREHIASDDGLWISDCSSIHTIGMRTAIDIFFLDRQGYVLRIAHSVAPNIAHLSCPLATTVVETGTAVHLGHDVLIGDKLALT